jgi:hypothetical protein
MWHQIRFWNQVGFRAKADFVLGLLAKHLSRLSHYGVRQEAGKEQEVKVPHGEGLANHPDPE